jgi:tRNA nucleotidyltransferase (CCA-adding enzyme)
MTVKTPKNVQVVLNRLNKDHSAFLVGGCVRDSLLGLTPNDFDVATSATPDQVVDLFHDHTVVLTGLQHGTVVVVVDGENVEVTTFRVDGDYSDGRRPDDVAFTTDLVTDLSRRDFTVNALAFNDTVGLVDPFGGADDLKAGVLRCVGNPSQRFDEDALRVLRFFRFAVRFNFTPDVDTLRVATELLKSDVLASVSKERVADELGKTLVCANHDNLDLVRLVVTNVVPSLDVDVVQNNPHHCFDVLTHTLHAVANVDNQLHLRLAVLLHDVGKASTKTTDDDGVDHFYGHHKVSAKLATDVLKDLRFSNKLVDQVVTLVRFHDRDVAATNRSVRRLLNKVDVSTAFDLLLVKRADALAQHPDKRADKLNHLANVHKVLCDLDLANTAVGLSDLAVNGHDLLNLGLKGKDVGVALNKLLNLVLDDPSLNNRDTLLNLL